jgi:hypothetical protein
VVEPTTTPPPDGLKRPDGDRLLTLSGYAFVVAAVSSFVAVVVIKVVNAIGQPNQGRYESMLDLLQGEVGTMTLFVVGIVAAMLGKGLLTTVRLAETRSIPSEDLPLVQQAVIDGKSEPIDQYVRLRSLSGMSGTFTKLGISGLPLTTVTLTLIFSFISLFPTTNAQSFLDLAKLTLGAFIGSFVQRQVEQRRQENAQNTGPRRPPDLPA